MDNNDISEPDIPVPVAGDNQHEAAESSNEGTQQETEKITVNHALIAKQLQQKLLTEVCVQNVVQNVCIITYLSTFSFV
jgi:hypothetical protein